MTKYRVTGRTWDHRHVLRDWGGEWDNTRKHWIFYDLSDEQLARLSTMVGVMVTNIPVYTPAAPVTHKPIIIGDDDEYYNYFVDKNPIVYFGFSSLAKFCDYVESLDRPPNSGGTCDIGWSMSRERVYVSGTPTLAAALDLARNGWMEGLGMHRNLETPRPLAKRRMHGMSGGSVNVGRMLAGNPVHMRTRKRTPGRKTITLFVQCTMWYKIEPYMAMMRALLVAAMVDRLEAEGYICNINAVCTSSKRHGGDGRGKQLCVRVKDAGQALSILDIIFALGHPSFSRRLFFAAEGSIPECGMSYDDRGIIRPAFDTNNPCGQNEFYIPYLEPIHTLKITADPMSMLQFIEPDGLPITLKER